MLAPSESATVTVAAPRRAGRFWRWLLLALGAAVLLLAARAPGLQAKLRLALEWTQGLGAWGPALFIILYVVAAVLLVPGSVLTLGAGAVFGVWRGTVLVSCAATLAATAAFLMARHFTRDAIARRMAGNTRFTAIDRAVAAQGWKIVLLTRLSPVFPFTLLNYAFGLTQVKLGHYVLASWLGMLPGTVMYVYLGSLAQAATDARVRTAGEWVLHGLGLTATVAVTLFITRLARRALAEQTGANSVPPPA